MTRDKILEKIRSIIYDDLELAQRLDIDIKPETRLNEIFEDSLDALSALMELEKKFQINISHDVKIIDFETFDKLINFIQSITPEQMEYTRNPRPKQISKLVGPDE